jgi:hypothetical protein
VADPYATEDELTAWLPADTVATDGARLLARASELLDDTVRRQFSVDGNGIPTMANLATALSEACCAQVEFWLEVGEDHDIEGLANRQASIGMLSLAGLPPELAPRAFRILHTAGLLNGTIGTDAIAAFFAIPLVTQ